MRRTALLASTALSAALALAWALAAAPASAQVTNDSKLPQVYTMSPTGVNLQTGHWAPGVTDLSIGPFTLNRGDVGPSWGGTNLGAAVNVTTAGPSIRAVLIAEGQKVEFGWNGSLWVAWSENSSGTELKWENSRFTWINRRGDVYYFVPHPAFPNGVMANGTQVLDHVDYADGSRRDHSYNSSGQLRTVISNRGYAIVLDYSQVGGQSVLTASCGYNLAVQYADSNATCAGATLKATYGYSQAASGSWLLTSFTDPSGAVTSYQYTPEGRLSCVTLPNSQTCPVTTFYGPQPGDTPNVATINQVRKQVTAGGAVWMFQYDKDWDRELPLQPGETRYSWSYATDPLGNTTSVRYANGVSDQLYEPGGALTQYQFSGSVPMKFTLPEGNIVDLYRDERENLLRKTLKAKPGSGLPDIVSTADYPIVRWDPPNDFTRPVGCVAASQKLCDKPIDTVDANGNRSDFTYDPAHGGVLTETLPAVNGVRPQKRYSYAQRYAWLSNGAGGYVRAATPVWVMTQMALCKSGAAAASGTGCANGASDEVVTTYDYGPDSGPNNLLLRGTMVDAGGLSLRTCYGYDWQGNKVSETKPRAGLAVCP